MPLIIINIEKIRRTSENIYGFLNISRLFRFNTHFNTVHQFFITNYIIIINYFKGILYNNGLFFLYAELELFAKICVDYVVKSYIDLGLSIFVSMYLLFRANYIILIRTQTDRLYNIRYQGLDRETSKASPFKQTPSQIEIHCRYRLNTL